MANSKGNSTAVRAYELAKPLAMELSLDIWDVVFEKEGASWYLRVYIDKEGGVSMDDCENFSRPFNKILDDEDFIAESYIFEVGSPGIGRKLTKAQHFEKCKGEEVKVRFIREMNGQKEIKGKLLAYTKESITVDTNEIKLSDTAYVKLNDDEDLF